VYRNCTQNNGKKQYNIVGGIARRGWGGRWRIFLLSNEDDEEEEEEEDESDKEKEEENNHSHDRDDDRTWFHPVWDNTLH
jgi:hypothetical protein